MIQALENCFRVRKCIEDEMMLLYSRLPTFAQVSTMETTSRKGVMEMQPEKFRC